MAGPGPRSPLDALGLRRRWLGDRRGSRPRGRLLHRDQEGGRQRPAALVGRASHRGRGMEADRGCTRGQGRAAQRRRPARRGALSLAASRRRGQDPAADPCGRRAAGLVAASFRDTAKGARPPAPRITRDTGSASSAPREDRWRIIGPGGGGALFHPTVSPHDARTALVSCDMTGNYITTDAGNRWRSFNLDGPVQFFLFDPIDPRVIYAKAGALFRSSDGGTTWVRFVPRTVAEIRMGDDHASPTYRVASGPRGDVDAMAIDPGDSRILYLAIDSTLWTSLDRGATWHESGTLPGRARRIWLDPRSSRDDRTLFVAGRDAIYRREAGRWRIGASPGVFSDVTGSPPRFYATAAGNIFVSGDGGMTWRSSPLPGFRGRATAIAASREQPDVAYVSF